MEALQVLEQNCSVYVGLFAAPILFDAGGAFIVFSGGSWTSEHHFWAISSAADP